MTIPLNATVVGLFPLEGGTPANVTNSNITFKINGNYVQSKFVVNPSLAFTVEEASYSSNSDLRKLAQKALNYFNKNVYYSDDEQMKLGFITFFQISITTGANPTENGGGIYPYSITGSFKRGYNGTTIVPHYGYNPSGGGYFANVYALENIYNQYETKNTKISGYVNLTTSSIGSSQEISFFTRCVSMQNQLPLDNRGLNLRFNIGSNYLTASDIAILKNQPDNTSIIARFNSEFIGKVIKVSNVNDELDTYEEMLITGVNKINVYDNTLINCPNDSGYLPYRIYFQVIRGNNGIIGNTNNGIISISTSYGNQNFEGINAWIEPDGSVYDTVISDSIGFNENNTISNTIKKTISDNINFNDNGNINDGPVILIAQDILGFSGYTIPFQTLKMLVQDNFLINENLEITSAKEILLILNDLFTLKSHSINKIDYDVLINETIGFYDRGNVLDYLDLFIHCVDFLQFGNTQTQFNIGQIIQLLVNDYINLLDDREQVKFFRTLKERVYDAFNLSNIDNVRLGKDFMITISDKINFNSFINKMKLDMKLVLEDILNFYVIAVIDGIEYECYAMNLENLALTRFSNYNFNSYCQFNGKYYGISKNGIANLIYVDEKGERVEDFKSGIKTGFVDIANTESVVNDFNSVTSHKKQLKVFYMYLSNDGQVFLRVNTNEGQSFDYLVKDEYNENMDMCMQDIGKAVKGTRYQFEITSIDNMKISEMICIPLIAQSGKKVG